ncbi:hypothetical protein AnigIFM56816_007210 [Aspergillus niger]|nr:hypothetical protein AnigIFM56816_007210 [Aspergillus niger]
MKKLRFPQADKLRADTPPLPVAPVHPQVPFESIARTPATALGKEGSGFMGSSRDNGKAEAEIFPRMGTVHRILESHEDLRQRSRLLARRHDNRFSCERRDRLALGCKTDALQQTLCGHEGPVIAITLLPDSTTLASAADETFQLWIVKKGTAADRTGP